MKEITMIQSWDKDPKRNMSRYLKNDSTDWIAVSKVFTGTEFIMFFTEGKRFQWMLKLWARLNGIKN